MKYFSFFLFIFFSSGLNAQNKKPEVKSEIVNITVFTSGARVERLADVNLASGQTEITFTGLSNQLDQQSVQLAANENITLLSVQTVKDFTAERNTSDREKLFLDSIAILDEQIDFQKKMLEVYKSEESMLKANESIGGESGVKTAELKEALDLHKARLTEVYKQQLETQKLITKKEKEKKTLFEQLGEFSKKRDSVNYNVVALVETKNAAKVKFQLFYNVKDAGWYPTYDVRLKDINTPLEFLMNANVFQRSGETWKNVSLKLSTGNPGENATLSELQPWKLGFYDPSVPVRSQSNNALISGRVTNKDGEPVAGASVMVLGTNAGTITDANGFFKLADVGSGSRIQVSAVGFNSKNISAVPGYNPIILEEAVLAMEEVVVTGYGTDQLKGKVAGVNLSSAAPQAKRMQTVEVSTVYQPTTLVYDIDKKYTIETDGKTSTIGIKDFEVPAEYQYSSIPKIDVSSFLTAKVADWQNYDLQPGEVSLYFEGNYLGKTYLDLSGTGDTLPLSLGKDNGIKIDRKLLKEFSSKKFIGSNITESRQYEISVRNTKKEALEIIIQDQFPVSVNKDITISDTKAPDAEVNKDTGIATWTLNLKPGEERKLTISYAVKYPKGNKVVLE